MMSQAGIEGNFRNHSLRKACATRLFRKGVDPQLIAEQTGHRSSAIVVGKGGGPKFLGNMYHIKTEGRAKTTYSIN